jgi:hypothetical protein
VKYFRHVDDKKAFESAAAAAQQGSAEAMVCFV